MKPIFLHVKLWKLFSDPTKFEFFLHRFPWYSTPNMALQKIIMTFFVLSFTSSRLRTIMRFHGHNSSKILSNRNEFSKTCSWVNKLLIIYTAVFEQLRIRGFGVRGPRTWNFFFKFSSCYFRQDFNSWDFHEDKYNYSMYNIIFTESEPRDELGREIAHWKRIIEV